MAPISLDFAQFNLRGDPHRKTKIIELTHTILQVQCNCTSRAIVEETRQFSVPGNTLYPAPCAIFPIAKGTRYL